MESDQAKTPPPGVKDGSAEVQPRNLFDLPTADGVNASERMLTALCERSFLKPWALNNVFTDEGFKGGKGSTKELCDALFCI